MTHTSEASRAVVLLGSNLEPERNLPRATTRLAECGDVLATSSIWISAAALRPELPDFHNRAILLATTTTPQGLRARLRVIESDLGRVRGTDRFGSRTIDLDIVLFDQIVDPAGPPILPDPDLLRFAHAIVPVAELEPERPHPTTGEPLGAIADRLAPGWRAGAGGGCRRLTPHS